MLFSFTTSTAYPEYPELWYRKVSDNRFGQAPRSR